MTVDLDKYRLIAAQRGNDTVEICISKTLIPAMTGRATHFNWTRDAFQMPPMRRPTTLTGGCERARLA